MNDSPFSSSPTLSGEHRSKDINFGRSTQRTPAPITLGSLLGSLEGNLMKEVTPVHIRVLKPSLRPWSTKEVRHGDKQGTSKAPVPRCCSRRPLLSSESFILATQWRASYHSVKADGPWFWAGPCLAWIPFVGCNRQGSSNVFARESTASAYFERS